MLLTTINVPAELGHRIAASALSRGTTVAGLLSELMDQHERNDRFAEVKAAYARLAADDDYWSETCAWEALSRRPTE